MLLYQQDGTFLEAGLYLDDDSFSTFFGHPPTSGLWSADATILHLEYLDFLEPKTKDYDYTCEDDAMSQRNFKYERLDEDIEEAVRRAVATGNWSDQSF